MKNTKDRIMKCLSLTLFLSLLCTITLLAQTDSTNTVVELSNPKRPPAFPGGEVALLQFLSENIQYPELARNSIIEGTVVVMFIVDKDGQLYDGEIVRDIGGGCGAEVLRVLKLMPAWAPGEIDGRPVKVRFTLPVRFKLQSGKEIRKERRQKRKAKRN